MIEKREIQTVMKAVAGVVREFVSSAATSLKAEFNRKFEELDGRIKQIPSGPKGERGDSGKDAPPVDIDAIVLRAAELVPPGRDGKDGPAGRDGKDGIDGREGPAGQDGAPGKDGERGADGAHGRDGKDGEPLDIGVIAERAALLIPTPKDGKDADPVDVDSLVLRVAELIPTPKDGEPGERGPSGIDGKDGHSVELADVEAFAERTIASHLSRWELDFERRAQEQFQRAIDRMPKPQDGKNGFELEDFSATDDGHGNITLTFKRGTLDRSFTFRIPGFEYEGAYVEGREYLRGHNVTFGGNLWMALRDKPETKPAEGSDWQLAVRKGRDGRDGELKEVKIPATVKLK